MRLPVIPIVALVVLGGAATAYLTLSRPPGQELGVPVVAELLDVDGVETEVAIAPDGRRYALIASGDLWFVDLASETEIRLTSTVEPESAPSWTGDGKHITFTRGDHTVAVDPADGVEGLFLDDARDLTSATNQIAFVRGRALWVARPDGSDAREVVPADPRHDVTIRLPKYSPTGTQIVFVKTLLNLHGEVWKVDLTTGSLLPIVADRRAENPSSAAWIGDDNHIVYLTDRSGGLAVWYVDLEQSTLVPLTAPMMGRALSPLGIDVSDKRIVVPRHTTSSHIATSDGEVLADGSGSRMEPAISSDGRFIAYTVENEGSFEIWMKDLRSGTARFLAPGRAARFSPDGNEVVYATTGLDGNRDIWKVDTRTGLQEPLTDDEEVDDVPDWSPDGRTIVFTSGREGGTPAVWAVPSAGGRRRRLNDGGYAPRFSKDGSSIAYWHDGTILVAAADGTAPRTVGSAADPVWPVWSEAGVAYASEGRIRIDGSASPPLSMWPEFEEWQGDAWLISSLVIEDTALWSLDVTFIPK